MTNHLSNCTENQKARGYSNYGFSKNTNLEENLKTLRLLAYKGH